MIKWRVRTKDGLEYAVANVPGSGKHSKSMLMHRYILGLGPDDPRIDHQDGNGLNNTRSNLRPATNRQNIRNSKVYARKATATLKGVYFNKSRGKFRAQIMCSYKKINLGSFTTEEAAAHAYDTAARKLFGEFARPNFSEAAQ